MKILFAGGGTGGHINPALSIADFFKKHESDFEALFIGTERGLETRLVPAAGYDIEYIDIRGFDRKHLLKNIDVIKKLGESRKKCCEIIRDFAPDVVVCTGGYVSGPVIMAAHKLGIPSVIHEQNVYPGLTVKGSVNYVDYVAVSFPETEKYIKKHSKCVLTGNPVREEILNSDKAESRKKLGISDKPFVLVFGGSLGAQKINDNMVKILPRIIADGKIQLLFGTGSRNYDDITKQLKQLKLPDDIKIVPYIDNMPDAMAAADLVVSRSGAITVSEIAVLGKPSILIPSPNVVRNHQEQNARAFEEKGAAAVICESELTPEILYEKINGLASDKKSLDKMAKNVEMLAEPLALEKLHDVIVGLAEKRKGAVHR